MHNLAIALHLQGHIITGSDDEIFEPSRSRLEKYGLLPSGFGWNKKNIHKNLDAVILGMHAQKDNPELLQAMKTGIKIYSFPEYLYEQTKNKKRVVIAGSHGKTTITSLILHVLKTLNYKFDYMVGSVIPGFDTMTGFDKDAEIAVFEGDEYLSSPLDSRPKFHHYKPFISLISGIAWDHMNVYPDYRDYKKQFLDLCKNTHPSGSIIYYENDQELSGLISDPEIKASKISYKAAEYSVGNNGSIVKLDGQIYPVQMIGKYNMENLQGAMQVCEQLGIDKKSFLNAAESFRGSARRQEMVYKDKDISIFRDFAHAPSKVKATVEGFREFFPGKKLIAFLELHTFSSLNKEFLPQYAGSLDLADQAVVFYNPEVIKHKKLPTIDPELVKSCFKNENIRVITDVKILKETFLHAKNESGILLMMSSGNFGGTGIPS